MLILHILSIFALNNSATSIKRLDRIYDWEKKQKHKNDPGIKYEGMWPACSPDKIWLEKIIVTPMLI